MRSTNRILIAVFLGVVSLPLAASLAGVEGADPGAENRELAAFPTLDGTWSSVAGYLPALGRWFDDHYAFRAQLVRWDASVRLFVLHTSPSRIVVVGRNHWLFYADDGASEDMTNASRLTGAELDNWHEAIRRARDWSAARRIAFVFALAPDKHVLYGEQLPETVRALGGKSRMDQAFAAVTDLGVAIDLRPALFDQKARERVYHKTDTHWNERGAYVAYQAIIDALRRQRPSVPAAWPRADFELVSKRSEAGDLSGMLGLKRALQEERLLMQPTRPRLARVVEPAGARPTDEQGRLVTEIPGSTLPRAVIFRDSFVSPLVPFLSEHFSRAVYLWQKDFVPEQVLEEGADVVIYEIVGRRLYNFTPSPDLIPRGSRDP